MPGLLIFRSAVLQGAHAALLRRSILHEAAKGHDKPLLYFFQMSAITLNLSDELAARLRGHEDRLPEILERGLRELNADAQTGFEGAVEVLEILAGLPTPEEILRLRPSKRFAHCVQELLERSRAGELDPREQEEWEKYEFLEHLVRIAKAKAHSKLILKSALDG